MVMTLRKRVASVRRSPSPERETTPKKKPRKTIPKPAVKKGRRLRVSSGSESGYEKCREQRMRENRERMEKLGIFSLSFQILKKGPTKSKTLYPKKVRNPPIFPRPPRSYEPRRSSRLSNVGQSGFLENERSLKDMGIEIPNSWGAEVYTEEDEKLLGDCETPWTLNVEGYGEDGERLYDPVNGTSCHQCRQKTLQKHTYCCKCRSGQGQLCGDCLYTRYGENLSEAVKNPSWLCPGCRGICNCSRCRRAKGWPPVTILYSKVTESGFKSVAHYLILTRRGGNKPQEPEDGDMVVDLTEEETPMAPLDDDDCSDTSAEWSGSDSDDSDIEVTKPKKENSDHLIEEQVQVITEVASESDEENEVELAEKNEVEPAEKKEVECVEKDEVEHVVKDEVELLEKDEVELLEKDEVELLEKDEVEPLEKDEEPLEKDEVERVEKDEVEPLEKDEVEPVENNEVLEEMTVHEQVDGE